MKNLDISPLSPKQLRLKKQKEAKKEYKLAHKHQSEDYVKLKNHTINSLMSLHKKKFDCGVLKLDLL